MQVTDFCKRLSLITLVELLVFVLFVFLSLYIAPYHEVWADEVQAFLIARDADWSEIFMWIPHQEGQPVLWHILLKILILVFGDGLSITYVAIFVMSLTVWLIVFKYNISLLYKLLLPFGYFFLYQYNIMARNYCLAYLALAVIGLCYKDRHKKIWCYTLSLAFLAETTSFYVPVAAALGGFYLYEIYTFYRQDYKKYIAPLIVLLSVGISILWQIFPIDNFYIDSKHFSLRDRTFSAEYPYVLYIFKQIFELFFAKIEIFMILFLVFIFPLCFKIFSLNFLHLIQKNIKPLSLFLGVWIIFFISLFLGIPSFYHQGLIWGLFLCSVYMFFPQYCQKRHYFFIVIALLQVYWGIEALRYDKFYLTSPQYEVKKVIDTKSRTKTKMMVIGYNTLPFTTLVENQRLVVKPTYHNMVSKGLYEKYQKLIDTKTDILIIDDETANNLDLGYYNDESIFLMYKIKAGLIYHSEIAIKHDVKVYIKRTLAQT